MEISATVFGTQYDNPAYQWQKSDDGGLNWTDIAGANGLSVFHVDFVPGAYHYRYDSGREGDGRARRRRRRR